MRAVCIFSGGLDSISIAAYLKEQGYELYLLTFDYGQRARNELVIASKFSKRFGEHKILDMRFMKELYGNSNALTSNRDIPNIFEYSIVVPVRNAIFLTIAAAWAFSINAGVIAYGAHKNDNNYPDCRSEFILALEDVLNLAEIDGIKDNIRKRIKIWSPVIESLSKAELLSIGYKILGDEIFESWSCYKDNDKQCGVCESCINRKKAFREAHINDKTEYALI